MVFNVISVTICSKVVGDRRLQKCSMLLVFECGLSFVVCLFISFFSFLAVSAACFQWQACSEAASL